MFKAPKFELKPKRVVEIPFNGNLLTGTMVTVNSVQINYPFAITKVKMLFSDEANYLIDHSWHVLRSAFYSILVPPAGDNLFERESPAAIFTGRSILRIIECRYEFPEGRRYIALYTDNNSPYAYDYNCSVTVEEL